MFQRVVIVMNIKNSITSTNTKITVLADTIQKARIVLMSDNKHLNLCPEETRRIILICLMYFCANSNQFTFEPISLKSALAFFDVNDIGILGLYAQDHLQAAELSGALNELSHINQYSDWPTLIHYALEALEYDVEAYFNVEVSHGIRNSNRKKKKNGIYYTPLDVANFIVSQCVDSVLQFTDEPSILDCSCGSGVFLIQSLRYLESKQTRDDNLETSMRILERCIWGIDISHAAVDCCKAVILQYYLDHYKDAAARLGEIWSIIDRSIFRGDATHLQEILARDQVLPSHFNCIIGNPPYVTRGRESNLFIPFVDNLIYYSSDCSCSALLLPLSICYSQGREFIRLRNKIQEDGAAWTFMNYDRSPDSLFGDQVKTRNTILLRSNTESTTNIFTTNLQRWTSASRNDLFKNYSLCNISKVSISKCVPKISSVIEKAGYECISSGSSKLSSLFAHGDSDFPLVVNGTAYNWLCVYDHLPPSVDENEKPYTSSTTRIYYLPDRESRDFCVAVLSNRIAYWFWSVIGDGFHFNSSFLSNFKVGKDTFTELQYAELYRLGRAYSEQIKTHPTVSYNAGKKIVNYSHWEAMDVVWRIEKIIIDALNLSDDFACHIEQWYSKQVHCNRDNEKR